MSSTILGDTTNLQDRELRLWERWVKLMLCQWQEGNLDVETRLLAKLTQLETICRTGSNGEEVAEAREVRRLSFNWNCVSRASICLCNLDCWPASSMLLASMVSG